MRRPVLAAFFLTLLLALATRAAELQQRWIYMGSNPSDEQSLQETLDLMRMAKEAGCTHALMGVGNSLKLHEMPADYLDRVARVVAAAEEMQLTLVPALYPTGYGGRYFGTDRHLAAGLPAKGMPFVVKGGVAAPDPTDVPAVVDAGFESAEADKLLKWTQQDFPGAHSFVDTEVRHSGDSSLKITGLESLPAEADGSVRVGQTIKVKPFQFYRFNVWVKADGISAEREEYLYLLSDNNRRRHTYTNLGISNTQDWTRHTVTFNTLEAHEIELRLGVGTGSAGTIWFDDISIEPAGLLNVLRREATPFTVTSADGSVTYVEGEDFEALADEEFDAYDVSHEAPLIALTADSRMKDGDTVLVSFYHPMLIYEDQVGLSMTDPKVFELMEREARNVVKYWPAPGYFMGYDEIRVAGWEVQPGGTQLKPGELLAKHVARGIEILRKQAPDATLYVWSDMFTPHHNARPFSVKGYYYMVNGNWDGAWEGLPSDVVVMNWYAPTKESMQWFADRGNQQVMAGYYDGDMKANISKWMEVSEGVRGVVGMMYTTWRGDYSNLPEFFRLLRSYPEWVERAPGEGAMSEK